jgi:2-phosphosulfolactate phosphatase
MEDTGPKTVEVCFTPALFAAIGTETPYAVVVVDILRATTALCSAFSNGLKSVIPVATLEEARAYKTKGYLVAAERDGEILDFADYGNSPLEYQKADIQGKTLAYCTTNGTRAIDLAKGSDSLVIGGFVNLDVLREWLINRNLNVVVLCAGWKNQFALEDAVFAGALAERLLESGKFITHCDSVVAARGLWQEAKPNLLQYHVKASHRQRLIDIGQDESIPYCFTLNVCRALPGLRNGELIDFLVHE